MKGTEQFKQTIKAYLDERAKTDELFAASYAKENKSLDGCIEYILSEVKKSGCNGFADEEIYGMRKKVLRCITVCTTWNIIRNQIVLSYQREICMGTGLRQ